MSSPAPLLRRTSRLAHFVPGSSVFLPPGAPALWVWILSPSPFSAITDRLSTNVGPSKSEAGPWRVTFVTNPDDCNLACVMCREHSPLAAARNLPARRMPIALVERVLEELRGTALREIIPSTKGEPLLYAGLGRMIDLCREQNVALNLTTNGTFPGRGAAAWAEHILPVASDIKVSWLGAEAATVDELMSGFSLEEVVENVRVLARVRDRVADRTGHRCRVSFQVTALEENVDELTDIVRLAVSLGVDRVKVNHLRVHFEEMTGQSLLRDGSSIRRWNEAVRACRNVAETCRLPSGERVLLQNFVECSDDSDTPLGPCPFLDREAWVLVDGRFAPCCAPEAEGGQLGDFGSVAERGIGEIWSNVRYRELVQGYQEHSVCRRCTLRPARPEEGS
jgi:MoaA/NifB/PqqE/SkfB family radical SAM enzyme